MLPKRTKSGENWLHDLKLLIYLAVYGFLFEPWLLVFVPFQVNKSSNSIAHYAVRRISVGIFILHCQLCSFLAFLYTLMIKIVVHFFFLNFMAFEKNTINSTTFESIYFLLSVFYSFPVWLTLVKIALSNDVETNPGDISNGFFTFCNWNLNSLAKDDFHRIRLIEAHNSLFNYDIISICETSLNDLVTLPDVMLENYSFVENNNPNNVKHSLLSYTEVLIMMQILFNLIILSNFKTLYENIKNNPYTTFFTGDFNGHSQLWWNEGDSNPEGGKIEDMTSFLGLVQLINEPTNFEPNKKPSCIDLIFTDQPNIVLNSGTKPSLDNYCHHQIIFCKVNFNIPPPPPFVRKIWKYDRANAYLIKRAVSEFPWRQHLNNLNPNRQVTFFTETLLNIMSNFIPNDTIKVTPKDPPWITKTLKTLLNRQNRLYKNFKRHGYKPEDKIRVDNFNAECMTAISNAKESYLTRLGDKLTHPKSSQKTYWKVLNKILNKCKAPKIPPLLVNNKFIVNCKEKASEFAVFFAEQCKPLINNSTLPAFNYITNARIDRIIISEDEITNLIRSLNISKANGPDDLSAHMLHLCDEAIAIPLKIIFDNILSTGIFPKLWKSANIVPIHKKSDKQLVKNYRPISLLPICSKLFEKIIFNQLYSYFSDNNLITKNQSGFRSGDSTTNQLIELVNEIHKSFDNRCAYEVRSVFLDISKAFDKVWHEGLIFKLKQNGVCGPLINLLESYLKDRKQQVVLNGSSSNSFPVKSGVPQGSVLGPLLFLIYINDLEKFIKSKIKFFADDTMIFSVVRDPLLTASELNQDLETINNWAYQWKLAFNPDTSKQAVEVLFSQKNNQPFHPPLFFNGAEVLKVNDHKHLGLLLDSKLLFSRHVNEKIKIARKSIGVLKYLSSYLPLKTLDTIYKLFTRSHFDYCDVIYHIPVSNNVYNLFTPLHSLMESIERIQYQAALAITGAWQGSSRNKLYEELGWESLSDRRWFRRLFQFYKIHNNMTPQYLKDNLPPIRRALYGNNNRDVYHNIFCRTTRYRNSFYPDSVKSWNDIGNEFNLCNSIAKFKTDIIKLIRPIPKSIFKLHDPKGLKYLFQLRLGLSPLRSHKKNHNFADTPVDWCECNCAPEDTRHFLLHCKFHDVPRTNLFNSINQILLNYPQLNIVHDSDLFLYGHTALNLRDNKGILLSTIQFIKATGKFKG